jgi:hypothetical protein
MSSEKSRLRSIAWSGVPARLPQSSGRRPVDLEGFTIDGDTVLARRILNGDLLVFQVLQDEFGISIEGLAPASTAGQLTPIDIAALQPDDEFGRKFSLIRTRVQNAY